MLYNIMLFCACMLEETTKNTGKRVRGYSKLHATNSQPLHKPFHTKKADGVTRKSIIMFTFCACFDVLLHQ